MLNSFIPFSKDYDVNKAHFIYMETANQGLWGKGMSSILYAQQKPKLYYCSHTRHGTRLRVRGYYENTWMGRAPLASGALLRQHKDQ